MRIDLPFPSVEEYPAWAEVPLGIYPYVGASASTDHLRALVRDYGGAVAPGLGGAKLAAKTPGVLADPAAYASRPKDAPACLIDCDEWLERQRAVGVPLLLTDTPRIRNGDRTGLRKALGRWDMLGEPTVVVLPIEAWWLRDGLACLTEEVKAAGRPVALVLHHHYNGLDATGAVSGLLTFVSAVGPRLPVVLLRWDISAVGAVAYGACAGFAGMSASTRHGPMPMLRKTDVNQGAVDRDESPAVIVPALHDYFKASKLPAFARGRRGRELLRCDDSFCRGADLLRIARLAEVDLGAARSAAYRHNMASHEHIARSVLTSAQPKDAWWERCKSGADVAASLIEDGVMLSVSPWLRQWLELGSPSHAPETVR